MSAATGPGARCWCGCGRRIGPHHRVDSRYVDTEHRRRAETARTALRDAGRPHDPDQPLPARKRSGRRPRTGPDTRGEIGPIRQAFVDYITALQDHNLLAPFPPAGDLVDLIIRPHLPPRLKGHQWTQATSPSPEGQSNSNPTPSRTATNSPTSRTAAAAPSNSTSTPSDG